MVSEPRFTRASECIACRMPRSLIPPRTLRRNPDWRASLAQPRPREITAIESLHQSAQIGGLRLPFFQGASIQVMWLGP